jgi:hypothetical protein
MLSKGMAKFPGAVATKPVSIAIKAFTRAIWNYIMAIPFSFKHLKPKNETLLMTLSPA